MVILVVFKVFLVVKNLEILIQIVPDSPIYYYLQFPIKIRDLHEIKKKNSISIGVFGYENKEKHPIYVSKKCCEEKYVDLFLIGEEGTRRYVFIKDFNTSIYDHTLHRGRKYFCRHCLQAFSTEEVLKSLLKDCF